MSKEKEYWLYFPETQQFLVRRKEALEGEIRYRLAFTDNPWAAGKGAKISWTKVEMFSLPSQVYRVVEPIYRSNSERYHILVGEE